MSDANYNFPQQWSIPIPGSEGWTREQAEAWLGDFNKPDTPEPGEPVKWKVTLNLSRYVNDETGAMTAGEVLRAACDQLIAKWGDEAEPFSDLGEYIFVSPWDYGEW